MIDRLHKILYSPLGPNHLDTAVSLNNLAALYDATGRNKDAKSLYIRALEIYKNQLGPDHLKTALRYDNIAMFFYRLEHYAEAANFGVQALEIFLEKLGKDHLDTQTVGNNFITILQKVSETNQTQQLSDHPLTQTILKSLLSNDSE
ncbi:MAG: tetratricopeptide repeat protein [Cyanobacteria bacterium P01_D01_bin.156]